MITLIGVTCKHSNVFSEDVLIARFLLGKLKITAIRKYSYHCIQNRTNRFQIPLFGLGDMSERSHLFPFRTEKLSFREPMIVFGQK